MHPARPAEELSTDTGSVSDQGTSDDEEIWWKQTWYGGAILRDGVPPGTVGEDLALPKPSVFHGDSRTSSPTAAVSRRS
eukprot:1074533-Pyramimonas_sp.AAC.1